jgi:hypothetical protein
MAMQVDARRGGRAGIERAGGAGQWMERCYVLCYVLCARYSERTHSGCRRFLVHGRVGERVGRHGHVMVLVWLGGRTVVAEVHGRDSSRVVRCGLVWPCLVSSRGGR